MKLFIRRLLAVLVVGPFMLVMLLGISPLLAIERVARFIYCLSGPSMLDELREDLLPFLWPKPCKHEKKP